MVFFFCNSDLFCFGFVYSCCLQWSVPEPREGSDGCRQPSLSARSEMGIGLRKGKKTQNTGGGVHGFNPGVPPPSGARSRGRVLKAFGTGAERALRHRCCVSAGSFAARNLTRGENGFLLIFPRWGALIQINGSVRFDQGYSNLRFCADDCF